MAKENFVLLHGQVYDKPRIFVDDAGIMKKASFAVKVLRRPYVRANGAITTGKLNIDIPVIMTMNPEIIRQCVDLCKGDMVDIRGVYTTREVKKKTICPHGHENISAGNFTFVTPIYICRREQQLSDTDGMDLLRKRSEISNMVHIIGTLCREPEQHDFSEGIKKSSIVQYQLASNRRFHIKDAKDSERTDYPWVKTTGKQAQEDLQHLHTGSVVYINGAIQTRDIERTITCSVCEETYNIKESVCEIWPYSVEYLMNCVFPEKDEADETEEP